MKELPPPILIYKTRSMSRTETPDQSVRLMVGRNRDHSQYVVWTEVTAHGGTTQNPVLFTESADEASESFNAKLQDLGSKGFPAGSEQVMDADLIARHQT